MKINFISTAITALFLTTLALPLNAASAPERPNILLLVAEDLSPRIGAFGDEVAQTPSIDELAQRGVRYTQTFTTSGVCAPSRAALITGVHQGSIGAQHMRTSSRPVGSYKSVPPAEVKAFPELLRAAGYYTFTDLKLDYQFSGTRAGSGPFTIWNDEGAKSSWKGRNQEQPFFGLVNFILTHESGTFDPLGHWPQSWTHLLLQLYRAVSGGSPDEDPSLAAELVLPPYYPDIPSVRREMARHYQNIQAMDQEVKSILDRLRQDGLADNTIVIWTTDHGDGLPRAKRELFDSGIKVPMIIYWPEKWRPEHLTPGTIDQQLISFVDLAPTILAMAGVDRPGYLQGRDFLDQSEPLRRYIYAARDGIDEVMDRQRAVRDQRFKYIHSDYPDVAGGHPLAFRDIQAMTRDMRAMWKDGRLNAAQAKWFQAPGEEQLYDLENDPYELHNLASDLDYRTALLRLRSALSDWRERVGDTAETDEAQMVKNFLCGGKACVTPVPTIRVTSDSIQITNPEPGASIAYRLDGGDWQVYSEPIARGKVTQINAKSIRYGWEESETVTEVFEE